MAAVQTQTEYPKGLDFEQVWAALMESRVQIDKTSNELAEFIEEEELMRRQLLQKLQQFNLKANVK